MRIILFIESILTTISPHDQTEYRMLVFNLQLKLNLFLSYPERHIFESMTLVLIFFHCIFTKSMIWGLIFFTYLPFHAKLKQSLPLVIGVPTKS